METFSRLLVASIAMFIGLQKGSQGMLFVATPNNGIESLTKNITLLCRTDIDVPNGVPNEIVLIQITKGDDQSVALLRSDGQLSYGGDKSRRLEAAGDIDNTVKGGYLAVHMHYPSSEDSGIYKCHVVYLDGKGVASYYSNQTYLDVDKPNHSKTEERLHSLETLYSDANRRILEMNATLLVTTRSPGAHAFSASISEKALIVKDAVVAFDDVITQQGHGYEPSSGVFTAPVSGLYAFFLTLGMEGKAGAGFAIQVGDKRELARLYVEDADLGDQSSVTSVTTLTEGEKVKVVAVYKTDHPGHLYPMKYSMFSGFLVKSA